MKKVHLAIYAIHIPYPPTRKEVREMIMMEGGRLNDWSGAAEKLRHFALD